MKRFDDQYQLLIELVTDDKNSKPVESKIKESISRWIDEEGYFLERKFQDDLKRTYGKMLNKKVN